MEKHPDGVYYHFGLSEWIREKFSDLSDDQVPNQADILVNIDGIPLCKSTLVSPRRRANVGQRDSFVRATSPRDVGWRA